jgi:anti-sigma factor RsiW
MTKGEMGDWALHAYVDNEIAIDQRAEIEALIRSDAGSAQKVEDWRLQKALLRQAYDGVLAEPLPPSLKATLRVGGGLAARPYLAMAAAVAMLLLGGLAGWFAARESGGTQVADIARDAIAAHEIYSVEVRHPVEVTGDDQGHLQAWLSKRLGTPFTIPDLSGEGYALLGGRLLAAGDQPAAQLMYEDARKNRVTIFLTAQARAEETAVHVERKGKLIACYWRDGRLAFALAGEMELDPMMKLAKVVYDKFDS